MILRKVKPDEKALRSALLSDLQKHLKDWSVGQTKDQVGKLRGEPGESTDATPTEAAETGAPVVDGITVESVSDVKSGEPAPKDGPEGVSGDGVGEDDGKVPGVDEKSTKGVAAADEGEESEPDSENGSNETARSLEDIIRGLSGSRKG